MVNIIGTNQEVTTICDTKTADTMYNMMVNTGSVFTKETTPDRREYLLFSEKTRDLVVFMDENENPVSAYILKKD